MAQNSFPWIVWIYFPYILQVYNNSVSLAWQGIESTNCWSMFVLFAKSTLYVIVVLLVPTCTYFGQNIVTKYHDLRYWVADKLSLPVGQWTVHKDWIFGRKVSSLKGRCRQSTYLKYQHPAKILLSRNWEFISDSDSPETSWYDCPCTKSHALALSES